MSILRNKTALLLLLMTWVVGQSFALDHEFSSEHWNASEHHDCLLQAVDLEDITPENPEQFQFVDICFNEIYDHKAVFSYSAFPLNYRSRAPPKPIS